MTLGIVPIARPVGPPAHPDIGGNAQAQAQAARLAHLQLNLDRNALGFGHGRVGIDPHRLEVAAGAHGLVELGDQLGVIGAVGLEGHHALQQFRVERRIAAETHGAQLVTRATVVDQFDIGYPGGRVDAQALAGEAPGEEAIARSLVLDVPFRGVIAPVIEHRAAAQALVAGQAERLELAGRPLDAQGHFAQAHRLTGDDANDQPMGITGDHFAGNPRLVVAQGLDRLMGLGLGEPAIALQ